MSGSGKYVSASRCTCARLRRSARYLTQVYDRALQPSGLRITQYQILNHAANSDGSSITELAAGISVDRTTLTRNLRPLASAGLIDVVDGPDRRSRAVRITASGRERLENARVLWRRVQTDFERRNGSEDTASLHLLLDRVLQRI